jgi:hypothetical protein
MTTDRQGRSKIELWASTSPSRHPPCLWL